MSMSIAADAAGVRLSGVKKWYGQVPAVRDVSLAVEPGEMVCLLGPSGCGKTTTLRIVAGLENPDAGEIRIGPTLVNGLAPWKRNLGMVFQNYALFPHMTVFENVAFGLNMRRLPAAEVRRQVDAAMAQVRLAAFGDRRPSQLSGGQRQRIALARAIVTKPSVLLLDEPLAALDKKLREQMQVEIKQLQRQVGVTTIFVTHDQSEALSLSDRLAVMSEGRIRQLGTPQEIYRRPCERFVASFVGDANVLRGRLDRIDGPHAVLAIGAVQVRVPMGSLQGAAASAPVDLYVRPEHLEIIEASGPCARSGTIVAQVYQGGHVDLFVECTDSPPDRLLVRSAGYQAMTRWPIGAQVGISISADEGVAFAIP